MSFVSAWLPGVQHLQNVHPLIIHFPIAFLMGSGLTYALALASGRESFAWGGLWMLVLGAISAVAAVATGLYAAGGVMIAESVRQAVLQKHMECMLAALGIGAILTVWALIARPFPKQSRWLFGLLFIALLLVITKGADYGGRLVYDYNAGGNACSQPIELHP